MQFGRDVLKINSSYTNLILNGTVGKTIKLSAEEKTVWSWELQIVLKEKNTNNFKEEKLQINLYERVSSLLEKNRLGVANSEL